MKVELNLTLNGKAATALEKVKKSYDYKDDAEAISKSLALAAFAAKKMDEHGTVFFIDVNDYEYPFQMKKAKD